MKGSRNFVVWMLLVALLCGALPASACSLLSARTPGMPPCCRHMVPGCSMGTLVTSKPSRQSGPIASCCQMNRDDTAIAVPRSSFLPEHAQTPPLLHGAPAESPGNAADLRLRARAYLPPGIPPGGGFILRI
jgi:hypothetical protein